VSRVVRRVAVFQGGDGCCGTARDLQSNFWRPYPCRSCGEGPNCPAVINVDHNFKVCPGAGLFQRISGVCGRDDTRKSGSSPVLLNPPFQHTHHGVAVALPMRSVKCWWCATGIAMALTPAPSASVRVRNVHTRHEVDIPVFESVPWSDSVKANAAPRCSIPRAALHGELKLARWPTIMRALRRSVYTSWLNRWSRLDLKRR